MNKILEGAKEALEIARSNAFPARVTWFMEFEKGKSGKIVVDGPFDQEVIDAMRDYLARQETRIPVKSSCGCVFCDLKIQLHHDEISGFHHVADGEVVPCQLSNGEHDAGRHPLLPILPKR